MNTPTRELLFGRQDVAGEALVVQQLEKRGERLRVAVMRRRGQEELVLEMRGNEPHQASAQALDSVLADGRRHVVGLVHDEHVEASRKRLMGRKDIA